MVVPRFCLFSTFFLLLASNVVAGLTLEKRASRTDPPSGAVIVKQSDTQAWEFATIQAAVDSLPNDSSQQSIYISSGTYYEQVTIARKGPLTIYGCTTDTTSHEANTVTITHNASAGMAGSDTASATMIVDVADFKLYNVNVDNSFGRAPHNGQALAISASGKRHGFYGVRFSSYQDTVLAESGRQFYAACHIIGAVDYIFGQNAFAFFHKNVLESTGPGSITAAGPNIANGSLFVINKSDVILSPDPVEEAHGKVFLGRPWTKFASVVYSYCNLGSHINGTGWNHWSTTPNTENVLFAEFDNYGPGAVGKRAPFSKKLTSGAGYTISDVLGEDYKTWVDADYL